MKKANPMPLGLLGLGMSTVLLSFSLMNTYPTGEKVGSFVPVMAILLGGLTLVIACVLNYLKGDLFGATTFGGFATRHWYGYINNTFLKISLMQRQ